MNITLIAGVVFRVFTGNYNKEFLTDKLTIITSCYNNNSLRFKSHFSAYAGTEAFYCSENSLVKEIIYGKGTLPFYVRIRDRGAPG